MSLVSAQISSLPKIFIPKLQLISTIYSTKECSLIREQIYISDYTKTNNYSFLKRNNFTHIINCAGNSFVLIHSNILNLNI